MENIKYNKSNILYLDIGTEINISNNKLSELQYDSKYIYCNNLSNNKYGFIPSDCINIKNEDIHVYFENNYDNSKTILSNKKYNSDILEKVHANIIEIQKYISNEYNSKCYEYIMNIYNNSTKKHYNIGNYLSMNHVDDIISKINHNIFNV